MVYPREELLGAITVLDEDGSGTVTCTGAVMQDAAAYQNDAQLVPPVTGTSSIGIFWVEDPGGGNPTLPKFTDSDDVTITLGQSLVTSVFGRIGDVTADSDDIGNNSTLLGGAGTVTDALNSLAGATGPQDLETTLGIGNETGDYWIEIADGFGLTGVGVGDSFTIRTVDGGAGTGNIEIRTGDSSGSTAGNINITTGTGSGAVRGSITLNSGDAMIWPASDGTNGDVLTTDGVGNLSFAPLPSGGITILSVVTTNSTIANGSSAGHRLVPVDTTGGEVQVNLPATPVDGESITIKNWRGFASTSHVIINGNGNDIDGTYFSPSDDAITNDREAKTYLWSATLSSWILR